MDERESEETTEFFRVPDMPGYYISSNAPRSGEFVPVAMHDKLKRQRDMLLEALKRYGRHQVMGEMCAVLAHGDNPCTCGLDAAIATVED